jgi:hypothetical protein
MDIYAGSSEEYTWTVDFSDSAEKVSGTLRQGRTVDLTVPPSRGKRTPFASHGLDDISQNVLASIAALFVPEPAHDSRTVKYASRYKLVFSLMIQDATQGPISSWEIDRALRRA